MKKKIKNIFLKKYFFKKTKKAFKQNTYYFQTKKRRGIDYLGSQEELATVLHREAAHGTSELGSLNSP